MRRVRESRGLTQAVLAELAGMQQSNLSAIENDRRVPSAETLNRLLVACGYELMATAGDRSIACELPKVGWFPDEDLPPGLPGDPPDEADAIGPDTPAADRGRVLAALLDVVSAASAQP